MSFTFIPLVQRIFNWTKGINRLYPMSSQFITCHWFYIRTDVEPGIKITKLTARLPLTKIGLGLQCGNLFGDGHDEKLVHWYMIFLRHLTGLCKERFGDTQRIVGHQFFSSCSWRKKAPGVDTGSRKWLAGIKSAIFKVTSTSARPFNAVSSK